MFLFTLMLEFVGVWWNYHKAFNLSKKHCNEFYINFKQGFDTLNLVLKDKTNKPL